MIPIINEEGTHVLDVITFKKNVLMDNLHTHLLENNQENFNFVLKPNPRVSQHLRQFNRLAIPGEDGSLREFVMDDVVETESETEVYCTGSHSELSKKKPLPPAIYEGQTVDSMTDTTLFNTGWQRGKTEGTNIRKITLDDYMTPYQVLKKIASTFELELRFRIETKDGAIVGRYVDLVERVGEGRRHVVVTGKNLISAKRSSSKKEVYNCMIGLGPEKQDGTRIAVEVKNEDAIKAWGEELWGIHEIESDNEQMTTDDVIQYTTTALNKSIAAALQYEVEAVDVKGDMYLGDEVTVEARNFNPPLYLDARVVGVERSITDKKKKKLILGEYIEYTQDEYDELRKQFKALIKKKANKNLYGPDGEPIGELGERVNVPDMSAGDFYSPNVPAQSTQDMTFFVSDRVIDSGAEPSDNNIGDGWYSPLRTVAEALRRTPKQLDHQYKILLAYSGEFFEYIRVDGFSGGGKLIIDGQGKSQTKLRNGITVLGTYLDVLVEELTIIAESTFEVFSANAGNIKLDQCVIKGNPTLGTRHGVYSYKSCNMVVTNSSIYGVENCLNTDQNGSILQINNVGQGTKYGLRAVSGTITGSGTAPGGDIGNYYKTDGGILEPADFTFPAQSNPDPPEVGTTTKQWSATDSDAYSYGQFPGWKTGSSDLLQGSYGSYGPYKGLWFFGSTPSTTVTGKTIKQIRIIAKRLSGSGAGTYVPIHFRPHGYTSKGGDPSLSGDVYKREFKPGERKPVTLPSSYHAGFENGTYKGIGIYSGSSDYARMDPDAILEITYEG